MRHVAVQQTRVALHWIRWWDDGSIEAIVHFPLGNAFFGDVEKLANVFSCIPMRDEPEGMLLQIFADVLIDHQELRSLLNASRGFFFFFSKNGKWTRFSEFIVIIISIYYYLLYFIKFF